ncbi:MAG: DUF1844 domain-containing protein [Pseudomonadota bacterium]
MEEFEHKEEFKISDKRRFTPEAQEKADEQPDAVTGEETKGADGQTSSAGEEMKGSESKAAGREQPPPPPMDFSSFVLSLANTALFQLGLIRFSENEPPQKDLPAARQTIDLLSLLEEKTRGNLTDSERKLLSDTLFQLRMAFVEAAK